MKKSFFLLLIFICANIFLNLKAPEVIPDIPALFDAIRKGEERSITNLAGHYQPGELVNYQDENGETALHIAARESTPKIVKLLLLLDADPTIQNNAKKKPIEVATEKNKPYAAGGNPLHWAVYEKDIEAVKSILKSFIDINAKNIIGFTPLFYAVIANNESLVKLLLNSGAQVNVKDMIGATPLHYAAFEATPEIVKLLIIKEANRNARDNNRYTPLFYAVIGDKPNNVRFLLKFLDIEVNDKDKTGLIPLLWAITNKHHEIAEILIDNGARINELSQKFETPLFQAVHIGDLAMVKKLIDYKTDINKFYNYSPLQEALIRYNAVKNKKESGDPQAFYEIIKLLIDHGAALDVPSQKDNKTARKLIQEYNLEEIQKIISQKYGQSLGEQLNQLALELAALSAKI